MILVLANHKRSAGGCQPKRCEWRTANADHL